MTKEEFGNFFLAIKIAFAEKFPSAPCAQVCPKKLTNEELRQAVKGWIAAISLFGIPARSRT